MKKEIEVKAKVADFDQIKKSLTDLGCLLSEPMKQDDKIFLPKDIFFGNIPTGTCVLRLRTQGEKKLLTLKKSQENELVSIEKETAVGDTKTMEDILELLGYKERVRVSKSRIKCNYNSYEICLDDVERLGLFIEVEKISDEPEEQVLEEIFGFMKSLGVDPKDRVEVGYDTLMTQIEEAK